jgi:hypothetical protein
MDGYKELLGMWISPNEGAKFWLSVLTEIHNRGVKDILIACVDGLTGFPNAIETVFPKTQVQLCMALLHDTTFNMYGFEAMNLHKNTDFPRSQSLKPLQGLAYSCNNAVVHCPHGA